MVNAKGTGVPRTANQASSGQMHTYQMPEERKIVVGGGLDRHL
ncbi:hypothetical protein FORC065_2519 [Yersinia enterocolitica]|nr:hypothetical protein FORC065_2519 [Yersinia enterocolitica]